jgi:hypothetical protein
MQPVDIIAVGTAGEADGSVFVLQRPDSGMTVEALRAGRRGGQQAGGTDGGEEKKIPR